MDKTFNLSDLHVTDTVLKDLAVKRRDTDEHPIFGGPLFLHGNSDMSTYLYFFQPIAGEISDEDNTLVLGSDDEIAMRKAMQKSFPNFLMLFCTRHIEQNMKLLLSDKVGMPKRERNQLLSSLFGPKGMSASATNPSEFTDPVQFLSETAPASVQRHIDRILPQLAQNVAALQHPCLCLKSAMWTNNNTESMNHVLKQAVDWKSLKLVPLIQKLHDLVENQYMEVNRTFYGAGILP